MEGVPPVDLLGSRPPGRESSTCKRERGNLLPPLARAGRLLQRRGDKRYTRRGRTFCSPGRETRVWALDNSMQALRQVARLPRNSCGRGRSNTAQNKRRRRRDPTPHRAGTYALFAVQRAAPQPSLQGVCLDGVLKLQVGGVHPERMYQGLRPRMKVELRREARLGGDRRWSVRAHVRGWLPSALQSCRCVYPVGVTDRGLSSRVMSELALITLGRDEFPSDISRYHARSFFFFFFQLEGVSICKGALLSDHPVPGGRNTCSRRFIWADASALLGLV